MNWQVRVAEADMTPGQLNEFRDLFPARIGVRCVVEPGGSSRSPEVATARGEHHITLASSARRLFHH